MGFGPDISIGQATAPAVASDPLAPGIIGAGLTGRPQITRTLDITQPVDFDDQGEPVYAQAPSPAVSLPPSCLRVLNSPHSSCSGVCAGVQPDGGCLCDIVREANRQGIVWGFHVSVDDWGNQTWTYTGPML